MRALSGTPGLRAHRSPTCRPLQHLGPCHEPLAEQCSLCNRKRSYSLLARGYSGDSYFSPCSVPARHLLLKAVSPLRRNTLSCKAAEEKSSGSGTEDASPISKTLDAFPALGERAGSVFLFLLWVAVVAYALVFSPNQTPTRDTYFIEKLVGLRRDNFQISTLYVCLFNAMGIYPLIFLSLLQPSGKSGNKVPLWPFTTLSFGLGFLSLGLYFALWKPSSDVVSPPSRPQLDGIGNLSLKGTESTITAVLILLIVLGLAGTAAVAALDGQQWLDYFRLFDESRLVHVSTIDFGLLTSAAPFWMWNDAQKRGWEGRNRWIPILSCIPLLGPAAYLVLRPKAN